MRENPGHPGFAPPGQANPNVASTVASAGDALVWDGLAYVPTLVASISTDTPEEGDILVWDGESYVPTAANDGWQTISLAAGWAAVGTYAPGSIQDLALRVQLSGRIAHAAVTLTNTTVATISTVAHRPDAAVNLPLHMSNGATYQTGEAIVNTDGTVKVYSTGDVTDIWLESVIYISTPRP